MRFGLCVPRLRPQTTRAGVTAFVRRAEELGYDSLMVSDHVVSPAGEAYFRGNVEFLEPLALLNFIAAITTRPRIGTSVLVLPYRNPVVAAKLLASADVLSEGRLVFGWGAGWLEPEFRALAASYAERGQVTEEYLQVILACWTEDDPHFEGRHYRLDGVKFEPKPLQKPRPPLWTGGNGRVGLRRAVQFGDVWHPTFMSPEQVEESLPLLDQIAKRHGKARPPVTVRATLSIGAPMHSQAQLKGSPADVAETVRRYAALGVEELLLDLRWITVEEAIEQIETFAREVRPQV